MTHIPQLIVDLALLLGAAAVVTLLFKWLKQPAVLGYIIAGLIVGPHFHLFPTIADEANIEVWAEMGVIFLLFSLGLEFSFKKLMKVGGPALITAIVPVSYTHLEVKWNFQKYLVNEQGELVKVFSPMVEPMSEELISELEK